MSDNRIKKSSPSSLGAELQNISRLQIKKITAKVKYRIIGNPLTLIISAMALEACGNSLGGNSLGNISIADGGDGSETGETIWFDSVSRLGGDGGGAGVTEIIYGDPDDAVVRSGSDSYIWSSGQRITIYEQFDQGEDTVRLGVNSIADVSFGRNTVIGDQFTTAEVTLSIAGQSGVVLPYTKIADSDPASYYQGVEKVHFDTDGNGIVDADELELNLIYQRQFNNGAAVAAATVTTAGSRDADLIIGFDIAGERDGSNSYVRDRIKAGADDDYVYGLKGEDLLSGDAGNDVLYGGAGDDSINGGVGNDIIYGEAGNDFLFGGADDDTLNGGAGDDTFSGNAGNDRFFYSKGDGDDEITEGTNGGNDTLVLRGFSTADVRSLERRDDNGVSATGNHLKLIFTPTTVLNADGSTSMLGNSVLLKDSINGTATTPDDTGVDAIIFDSNNNGVEDNGETVWYDEDFAGYLTSF